MSKLKPAALLPGTVVGAYRIVRNLAAGGFGMVYLALNSAGKAVAIKEYLPATLVVREPGQLQPQVDTGKEEIYRLGLKCFFEEGRSLSQISHPSVVSVLDFFSDNATVYLVMNYLEGASLQDFIVTARGLNRSRVLHELTIRALFGDILQGLRIVHQSKLLHLDIKPENIFIAENNKPVLIDFGAAREVLSRDRVFVRPMYTAGFAAPEMYRSEAVLGPWTDIYAVGASIYACMKSQPPSEAPQRLEQDRSSIAMGHLRGVYSDNLIEVVQWCLSLDPLARPQSVFALQKELGRGGGAGELLSFREKIQLRLGAMFHKRKTAL